MRRKTDTGTRRQSDVGGMFVRGARAGPARLAWATSQLRPGMAMRPGAALLIGVGSSRHADRVAPLRYAARDAAALAGLLADPGQGGFPAERVLLCTNEDAGRDELVSRISKWLPEAARGAEVAILYFAGHGIVHRMGSREEG